MTGEVVATGLSFPESPRWRDGRLYLSDMGTRSVVALDVATGELETVVAKVPGAPSGLAWDDDGRLLVVSMARRVVFRDDGGERLTVFADLTPLGGGWRNDAVRHPNGQLYVGAVDNGPEPATIAAVAPDGAARVVATDVAGPNGMVVSPDGRTLLVDELDAGRVTAFTIADDGSLRDRRVHAELPDFHPDGCCGDAEDALWVASAGSPVVRRIAADGRVVATVEASQPAFACMLGGDDRRTLLVCTAPGSDDAGRAAGEGRIEAFAVDVPGAGWP